MLEALKAKLRLLYDRSRVSGIAAIILSLFFLLWHLGKSTAGFGPNEVVARQASQSFQTIADNPLNAPQKLLQLLAKSLGGHSLFFVRLSTVLITLTFIVSFYLIARSLFAKPAAIFGTLFLLATPWFIVAGRQASPEVLIMAPAALAWVYLWFLRKHHVFSWLSLVVLLAACLYIPGLAWLLIPCLWLLRKPLKTAVAQLDRTWLWLGILLGLGLLAPLILAFSRDWQLVKAWLLIPAAFGSAVDCLRNIGWAAASLVWRTKQHFDLTVGRWPLLDVLQLAIGAFGVFALWDKARSLLYGLGAVILLSIIAAGLNRSPAILLLSLPAIGIIFTAGFRYLYLEWRTIFPRNPIPQAFAIILISAVVVLQLFFAWRSSQAAWPNSPEIKSAYVLK